MDIYVAFGVIVIAGLIWLVRSKRVAHAPRARLTPYTGPTNVHYICAGCANQFAHTKRTIAAWQKGIRRITCNTCHKKWRDSLPSDQPAPAPAPAPPKSSVQLPSAEPTTRTRMPNIETPVHYRRQSRSGCLGVLVLFAVLSTVFVVLVNSA